MTRLLAVEAEERLWTQLQLSARTGITQPQLSRAFRGQRVLELDEMAAICDALGLNLLAVIREAQQQRR